MTGRAYLISKTLEQKIAIAESSNINSMYVTLDVLKEIAELLKENDSIVRCKDCVYGLKTGSTSLIMCGLPFSGNPLYDIDYYCADGKRK